MTVVMSIVADSPKGSLQEESSDGNTAINTIVRRMSEAMKDPKSLKYTPILERAVYIRDIARKIKNATPKPDIIQLVGHGSAGRVEFGSYWKTELDPKQVPAVLDSNPDSYGMLREVIPPTTKVFLLGCDVGSAAPSGYVASGRALLFDMEDMTGANIYAADDLVYPELFTDGFLYLGSLVTSTGKPANPAALANLPSPDSGSGMTSQETIIATPQLQGLQSAPAFGAKGTPTNSAPPTMNYFNRYIYAQPQPKGLLAMAEFVFAAKDYARVEAICCLRYLRAVRMDGTTVYFRPPPPNDDPSPIGVPPPREHFESAKPTLDELRRNVMEQ